MKAKSIPGFTSERELDIIYEWAKMVPENGVILEIGSFFGRSAIALAEGAPSAKVYCIDLFDTFVNTEFTSDHPGGDFWQIGKTYNKVTEFAEFTKGYNIIPLKLPANRKVYPYENEDIDLLFLDGSHKNPSDMLYLTYFKEFLKKDALICGHDYADEYPDVIRNVKNLEKNYKTKATFYEGCSLWSIRIKE